LINKEIVERLSGDLRSTADYYANHSFERPARKAAQAAQLKRYPNHRLREIGLRRLNDDLLHVVVRD